MSARKKSAWIALIVLLAAVLVLAFGHKRVQVRLLYATNGNTFDPAAYSNFEQSIVANSEVSRLPLDKLNGKRLKSYDAVYLDVSLKQSDMLRGALPQIEQYVQQGGHLFVENELLGDIPLSLLGASAIAPVNGEVKPKFDYPHVRGNLQGMQDVYRQFADNFTGHAYLNNMDDMMPGFDWGQAVVPSTAETIVSMNGQALFTVNRFGSGSVVAASTFLPNRYFITGFDLLSGMDPAKGFPTKAALHDESLKQPGRSAYFGFKTGLPQEPYFHFAFATANHLLRNEYVSYISKETFGYSLKKVFGPYGRPAMAYQNHFEALPAFEHKEGIAWAELLKTYNQLPSFSLVRSSFDWHHWYEGVTVHLNTGSTEQPQFVGEFPNSFYSSGTLITSEGSPLTAAAYPGKNELGLKLEEPYRAYPALIDTTGSGRKDLIVGSADGSLYKYPNTGQSVSAQMVPEGTVRPDGFGAKEALKLSNGQPFRGAGFATVTTADLNGNGLTDLVVGSSDGTVVALLQQGKGVFAPPVPLLSDGQPIRVSSHSAPAVGDLDGDGTLDLVVGDQDGGLTAFYGLPGKPMQFGKAVPLFKITAGYAAPAIRDMNGDKQADLVIGNNEGDLLVYEQIKGTWLLKGPIQGATNNQMGSKALVGGQYSVPLWADLNHDGKEDLLVGQLQYSQPVPIDDPSFPYKKQLQEFLDYARTNKLEIVPHVYVHSFLSSEQEKLELQLQRKSFAALGLPWTKTGTNQHTWRINQVDRLQTLRNENNADIWYNFGFKPSDSPTEPQWGREFLWSFPFLLQDDKLQSPMLLHAPGFRFTLSPDGSKPDTTDIYKSYASLDMPIDYFEHIEYQYDDPDKTAMLTDFVRFFDKLRSDYDYNFMSEPQMARSFLATMKTEVRVERPWLTYAIDKLKTKLGRGLHVTLSLSADTGNVPGLAAEYRDTAGVVFEPGEAYANYPFATDSPVFTKKDRKLYIGLGLRRLTSVSVNWGAEPFHLVRSNVPVEIKDSGTAWTIRTGSDGMQQIKLYSPRPLDITGDNLKIEQDPQDHMYTVTHFGEAVTITVKMPTD
ncbi:FG-GAP repeat domain-containing protein [Paenibacillus ginsengarvi]|uniref:FG-GAP repeat domain-containing protein n=1 Tax=Paenibacillus ginsengarvi TaxID=400777 RepID=UPI001EFF972C|nr:VCBS repeat-containing protein [Paenibacillus ginsengarvi]